MAANLDLSKITLPPIATDDFLDGVKDWLENSVLGEERPSIPEKMKVIDCVKRRVVPSPLDCVYIALSYVWGTNQACPSLEERLPQTREDSITTVLHLGYRYLWVDRYCIDQAAEIKHIQIQQMGAVYAGAVMTIIACAGDDPTFGLPGISRDIDRSTETWPPFLAGGYLARSTWLKRGWTFQENYLSKRRLFFTEIGPVYICESSYNSTGVQGYVEKMVETILDNRRPRRAPIDFYAALSEASNIMACYYTRRLKYESDLLNAIVGVLNTLSAGQFPIRHIWGVPFSTEETANGSIVTIALHWSSQSPGTRRSAFPSWSSLGWSSYKRRGPGANIAYSCLKDFNIDIRQNNKFQNISQIEEGYQDAHCMYLESQRLQITAYSVLSDTSLWIGVENDRFSDQIILLGTNLAVHIMPHWDVEQHALDPDTPVLCVFQSTLSHFGLILECHGKYYERVGCFVMDVTLDSSHIQNCTEELCDKSLPSGSEAVVASESRLIERRTFELR